MSIIGVAGNIIARKHSRVKQPRHNKKKQSKKLHKIVIKTVNNKRKESAKYRHYQLYALELKNGNYYIGMTSYQDVMKRYNQHVSIKGGAKWTKLHTPIRIIETRHLGYVSESESAIKETDMTLEYISKYGIRYVRGGGICQVNILFADRAYKKALCKRQL